MKGSALTGGGKKLTDHQAYDGGERRSHLGEDAKRAAQQQAEEQLQIDMRLARSLEPLKSLSESHLEELLRNSTIEVVFRGQALFESGTYDRQHIYLIHGDVELLDNDSQATLVKAGSSVLPLAHRQPRTCRAMARSDCSVLRIESDYLDKMLTWSQVAEYLLLDVSYQRDLDEDAEWMMTILKSNLFFKVPPTNAPKIFDRVQTMEVRAGEAILRQGEIGDNCYFIKQGQAEVRQSPDGMTPPVKIAEIGPGRCFGEDALVYEQVRNASVIMQTDGVLMYITKRDFLKLLKEPKVKSLEARDLADTVQAGAVCIDVRTLEEYEAGHLEQAINIPLNLLRIKTRLLNKQTPYIFYCDTGRRSRAAVQLLRKNRYNAVALEGGLQYARQADGRPFALTQTGFMLKDGQVIPGE